jgi:hypothetical protein
METLYSIFPAELEWPPGVDDIMKVPLDASSLRLVSGAKRLEQLPALKTLKALWCFDIDEKNLRSICECTSLESIYIGNIKTENFGCLRNLPNLKILGLDGCSRATSLREFGRFQSLSGLAITHFKNVHDLGPLAVLRFLRALAVSGSIWTRMRVESFRPLGELRSLEFLALTNIKAEDESLRPLEGLTNLTQLDIANFYPVEEFAWLSRRLRSTECAWFQPYIEMENINCKKCERATMVLFTGKRKPLLCSQCDKKAFEKHVRVWNELSEKAADNAIKRYPTRP